MTDMLHMATKGLKDHLRGRIKAAGIKANVRLLPGSRNGIQVYTTTYETKFTHDEQRAIRMIALVNGLTRVRGLPIDVERMTDPDSMEFYAWSNP